MSPSLLSLAILATHVSAFAFRGPQATAQAEAGDLVFPPETTAPPKVHADLFRRQNVMTDLIAPDNTCGYFSGRAGAGYTCGSAYLCAFFPETSSTSGFVGCCDPSNFNCDLVVTCINSLQYYSSSICDNGCEKDTFTLKCTASTAPYCNGIRFTKEGVQDYFCDSTYVSTWQIASTTYSLENDGRVFSPLVVTISSAIPTSGTTVIPSIIKPSTTSAPPSQPSSSAGSGGQSSAGAQSNGGSGSSPTTQGSNNPTTTPAPVPASSGTPIGAIVGGAVGGVAGLALIALAVFFILRRNKNKNNTAHANNAAPPPTYLPPQDPNNSAYAATSGEKPGATVQDAALAGHWSPGQTQTQYPPQMQEQQQYPSHAQQQQYAPQTQDPRYQQQPYQPQMQQQLYPNVAEVQGSYGQEPQPQNPSPASYYPQNQSANPHYSVMSSATQPSPNSQSHLSAAFPDRGETTSPVSAHHASELGTPGGPPAPLSPAPTYVSSMGAAPPTPAPAPTHAVAPGVEGRAEMSANMAGGPFPNNAYEVPGSDVHHQH